MIISQQGGMMLIDKMSKIEDSLIHYGPSNDRIYLMKLGQSDVSRIIPKLTNIAKEQDLGKIFAKVPQTKAQEFIDKGFVVEAQVPGYFQGKETGVFLSKFRESISAYAHNHQQIGKALKIANAKSVAPKTIESEVVSLNESHAEELANIYEEVFESYPFPVNNPEFIKENMESNVHYFGVYESDKLVSVASAEVDKTTASAEMTDFATLKEHRGQGLALDILNHMHVKAPELGIKTAYTMARAESIPMNVNSRRRVTVIVVP
jgi:putative beta-lysine N-acetyltransferase